MIDTKKLVVIDTNDWYKKIGDPDHDHHSKYETTVYILKLYYIYKFSNLCFTNNIINNDLVYTRFTCSRSSKWWCTMYCLNLKKKIKLHIKKKISFFHWILNEDKTYSTCIELTGCFMGVLSFSPYHKTQQYNVTWASMDKYLYCILCAVTTTYLLPHQFSLDIIFLSYPDAFTAHTHTHR